MNASVRSTPLPDPACITRRSAAKNWPPVSVSAGSILGQNNLRIYTKGWEKSGRVVLVVGTGWRNARTYSIDVGRWEIRVSAAEPCSCFTYANRRSLVASVVTDVGGPWDVGVAVGGVCGEIAERCGVEVVFGVAESRDMKREWTHGHCSARRPRSWMNKREIQKFGEVDNKSDLSLTISA